jgi:glutathione S-transferase
MGIMPFYTAIVTLLAVAFCFYLAARVVFARGRYGVHAPAVTGHPEFERIFRAHQNMLEWMPLFFVPLWICAFYLSDRVAAGLGLAWVASRIVYFIGYTRAAEKRISGFMIQTTICVLLFFAAVAGLALHANG